MLTDTSEKTHPACHDIDTRARPLRCAGMDVYHHEWRATKRVRRATVDLTPYPDLVVMYLGLSLRSPRGIPTLLKFMRRLRRAVEEKPDGLLLHEPVLFLPFTAGLRQYWRDFESFEAWARAPPHRLWWKEYLQDSKGTGLWHETYFMRGGIEAIYDNLPRPTGLTRFADLTPAEGGLFQARDRAERARRRSEGGSANASDEKARPGKEPKDAGG